VCEIVSGKDLHAIFQEWIYGQYYPRYEYTWQFEPQRDSTRVRLHVYQRQTNTGLFTMPIDVFVDTNEGTVLRVIQNAEADRRYTLTVPGAASNVELDRDGWILKTAAGAELTGVPGVPIASASPARLEPGRPNPFNASTVIPLELPRAGPARLAVYDAAGRLVCTLLDENLPAGRVDVRWDGRDDRGRVVATGTYFARLSAEGARLIQRLTVVK